jgi:mannose-6-phosphate isomerase
VKPAPQRLEPIFSPRIWGTRSLAPLFPDKTDLAEPLGEAWLTSVDSKISTSEFRGKTLGQAWREMPSEWRGTQFTSNTEFPLLVKFIFPTDMLSLQVHPDDAYAAKHEQAAGGRGKTEMWHVVSADPNAELLFGLKPGSNRQEFLARLKDQTLESIFQPVPISAGDTIFVPPGTPHAIGPGMIVCEVQEYSDLTYRVYDYGRVDAQGKPRDLHIDKALEVTNFASSFKGKTKRLPLSVEQESVDRSLLAACPFFATELWTSTSAYTIPVSSSHFDLIVLLSGRGVLRSKDFTFPIEQGECWFLPANLEDCHLVPIEPTKMIRAYVPNLSILREELQRGPRPGSMPGSMPASMDDTVFD